MLLSIDGTFLAQIANFIAFWVLLNYVFIAPTRRAIEARQRHIAEQQSEAERLGRTVKEQLAQAETILEAARRSTAEIMRTAAADAAREAGAIENQAIEESAAIVQLAHANVASERRQATAAQAPFVDQLAREMVDRAIGFAAAS